MAASGKSEGAESYRWVHHDGRRLWEIGILADGTLIVALDRVHELRREVGEVVFAQYRERKRRCR